MKYTLEICSFNIQSALVAEKAGAHRVELCDSPVEGGTTPSIGCIRQVKEKVSIPVYPIIRPRAGNYFYDDDEFEIIRRDIEVCKQSGCEGISVGVQLISGDIDVERMKEIVGWAYPMEVTCNRVFDAAPDPMKALEELIACGCSRILTSGQKSSAPQGTALIRKLIEVADNRIIIMPGAGIRSDNIAELARETGATEFHTSARKVLNNPVLFQNPQVLDNGDVYLANENEIKAIIDIMKGVPNNN